MVASGVTAGAPLLPGFGRSGGFAGHWPLTTEAKKSGRFPGRLVFLFKSAYCTVSVSVTVCALVLPLFVPAVPEAVTVTV